MTTDKRSLLVDYSRCGADIVGRHIKMSTDGDGCYRKRQTDLERESIPDCIYTPRTVSKHTCNSLKTNKSRKNKSKAAAAAAVGTSPVTFQLRRSLDIRGFLGCLKLHYSESDLDLRRQEKTNDTTIQCETNESGKESTVDSFNCNSQSTTQGKKQRRETLKRALRKTQSLRNLDVDTSPLSNDLENSKIVPPLTSRSAASPPTPAATTATATATIVVCSNSCINSNEMNSNSSIPNTQRSMKKLFLSTNRSSSLKDVLKACQHEENNNNDDTIDYVPISLLRIASRKGNVSSTNLNRRELMLRQRSFVTASRIRHIRLCE